MSVRLIVVMTMAVCVVMAIMELMTATTCCPSYAMAVEEEQTKGWQLCVWQRDDFDPECYASEKDKSELNAVTHKNACVIDFFVVGGGVV